MRKIISKILLIISFLPILLCFIGIVNCVINGYGGYEFYGVTVPKEYGFNAIREYLYIMFSIKWMGIIYIPIFTICLIFQIIYFKKLRS